MLMLQWFWSLLYESNPAEFRSAFGLAESVVGVNLLQHVDDGVGHAASSGQRTIDVLAAGRTVHDREGALGRSSLLPLGRYCRRPIMATAKADLIGFIA